MKRHVTILIAAAAVIVTGANLAEAKTRWRAVRTNARSARQIHRQKVMVQQQLLERMARRAGPEYARYRQQLNDAQHRARLQQALRQRMMEYGYGPVQRPFTRPLPRVDTYDSSIDPFTGRPYGRIGG